jgi:uncharacterized repeat protein (TIGR01451 family)
LRWLAVAALLLAFLLICCVAEVTMRALQPRNAPSELNLLSQDNADYGPWSSLGIGAIPPGLLAAQAADRATATVQAATGTPTPVLVGSVPTAPLEVVPAPINFPTPTPDDAFILVQPTATPRPAGVLPTQPPATVPPPPTIVPDTVPPPPSATSTPTPTPTRTRAPNVEPTNTPRPDDTEEPSATPRPPVASATRVVEPTTAVPATQVPPTDTPRPATPTTRPTEPATATVALPTDTPTNVPLTNTPRPTSTNTPRPRPTDVPPTDVPPTDVPPTTVPATVTPTATSPPTSTPTSTPTATNVPGNADITVDKNGPANVLLNLDVTYLVTISNIGPDTATNVVLLDTPTGVPWTFVAATSDPACTSNGTTISCAVGTIDPGGNRSLTVTLRPGAVGQLVNTATVSATEIDPLPTNNTDQVTTTIAPAAEADLRVVKTGPSNANLGDTISYNLAVTNAGPATATGVVAVDTPSGVNWTFNSGTFPGGVCSLNGAEIRCPIGTIPVGETVNVSIVLRVDSGGTLRNRADVSGAETDPVNGDNTSSVQTNVAATSIPGVTVNITAAPDTAQNNVTDVTYTITIANGTGAALTFTLFDTTFTTFDVRTCTPSSGTCTRAVTQPGPLSWDGPVTVPAGGSITMDIVGRFVTAPTGQACFPSHTIVTSAGTARRPGGSACVTVVP